MKTLFSFSKILVTKIEHIKGDLIPLLLQLFSNCHIFKLFPHLIEQTLKVGQTLRVLYKYFNGNPTAYWVIVNVALVETITVPILFVVVTFVPDKPKVADATLDPSPI